MTKTITLLSAFHPQSGGSGLPFIEPLAMWQAILGDLVPEDAGSGHRGALPQRPRKDLVAMATSLARRDDESGPRFDTIALSGGCFQNRVLFEEVVRRLEQEVSWFSLMRRSRRMTAAWRSGRRR